MIKSLTFFPNGNVLAFDEAGEQMPEIQVRGWMELYFDILELRDVDVTAIEIKAILNDGKWKKVLVSKGTYGWCIDFLDL